jgi:hypothetical protein
LDFQNQHPNGKPITFSHGQGASSHPAAWSAGFAEVQCDRGHIAPIFGKGMT